jgi:ABC-type lipoprotein export system ATPase subunit
MDIQKGEFVAIMGSSGSGKSTLLHILGCLVQPMAGSYFLGNTDIMTVSKHEISQIRAKKIGFVFQMFHLLPAMTVQQNIALPFLYNDIEPLKAHENIQLAIKQTGLAGRINHKPNELSGGEMQRVAIARALAVQPEIILADEPTGNLDSRTGREILSLFQQLHKTGSTIVMVTHDENVASMAQRILILQDGRFQ